MCRWQVKDSDVEVVRRAIANHHLFFTHKPLQRLWALQLPSLRKRVLWLLPLHRLVQRWAREGQVTSRGFRHIILQHTWEEGTRWSGQLWLLKQKWMTHGASGTWVLVLRGKRIDLLLAQRRSRRLLLRTDLNDRVVVAKAKAKAKAKVNHSRVGGTSMLLTSRGR